MDVLPADLIYPAQVIVTKREKLIERRICARIAGTLVATCVIVIRPNCGIPRRTFEVPAGADSGRPGDNALAATLADLNHALDVPQEIVLVAGIAAAKRVDAR